MIKLKDLLNEEKPGLWANIRAKQARGEKPAHGNSDAHKDAVKAAKEINKEESVNETKEFPSKEKLVAYMVKGGHNKKDSEKVVDANYEYVKKHYKNAGIPKISDILWTVESVNEGRLSFGDLKKGQVLFNKFRSGRKYTILDVNPKVATVKNLETGNVMQIYSLNNYELKESVNEAKSPYEVYHKSYTSAIEAAREYAEKKGFEIDNDDAFTKIGMGPRKPSEGKTNKFSIQLSKDGKLQRKQLHIQVYGMRNSYELNAYIG
jgi:hypothetical protein